MAIHSNLDGTRRDELVLGQDAVNGIRVTLTGETALFDPISGEATIADMLAGGGGGLTPATHEILDTLVHELAEDYYEEYTYSSGRVATAITWETAAKLKKIREEQYTYTSGRVSQTIAIQYNAAGTEEYRLTETYTYSSGRVASVACAKA